MGSGQPFGNLWATQCLASSIGHVFDDHWVTLLGRWVTLSAGSANALETGRPLGDTTASFAERSTVGCPRDMHVPLLLHYFVGYAHVHSSHRQLLQGLLGCPTKSVVALVRWVTVAKNGEDSPKLAHSYQIVELDFVCSCRTIACFAPPVLRI